MRNSNPLEKTEQVTFKRTTGNDRLPDNRVIRFTCEMKNSTGIAAAVFLFLSLYVSTPPLVLKACGYPTSPRFQTQLDIFYWPLSQVYDHVPPYRWFIDWQFEVLGVVGGP